MKPMGSQRKHWPAPGFTVVELLIVIVVIGILATLTIIAYSGIQKSTRLATTQHDIEQVTKVLETYRVKNNETYPASLVTLLASTGVSFSSGNTPYYSYNATTKNYCLTVTTPQGEQMFTTTFMKSPILGSCEGMTGWWPLNKDVADYSPTRSIATNNGAVQVSGQNSQSGAYSFNGTDQYIDTNVMDDRSIFSFSIWVRPTKSGGYQTPLSETRDCCGTGYRGFQFTTSYSVPESLGMNIWNGGSGAARSLSAGVGALNT